GHVISASVVSRAATFVFFLGDRFFGVVTAYVTGPEADRYHFTSALPVQVLHGLAPVLAPCLGGVRVESGQARGEPSRSPSPATGLFSQPSSTPVAEDDKDRSAPDHNALPVTVSLQTGETVPEAATPIRSKRSKMRPLTRPRAPFWRDLRPMQPYGAYGDVGG